MIFNKIYLPTMSALLERRRLLVGGETLMKDKLFQAEEN